MSDFEYAWTKDMLLLDRTDDTANIDIGYPFALDDLLCRQAGEGGPPVCHLWRHPRAFVMGSRDSRLPGAADAVRWLEDEGYAPLVRYSGGAAVPLDDGVINISLIMPISGKYLNGFHGDFERMYALIRRTLEVFDCTVKKGEILGSYCPGDYDLHIGGYKFCGIAQRRQVRAMIIQAFVLVEGSGAARAELVKAFYERAGVGAEPDAYPKIVPASMVSLQEKGAKLGAVGAFTKALIQTLHDCQSIQGSSSLSERIHLPEPDLVQAMSDRLKQRYPLPG